MFRICVLLMVLVSVAWGASAQAKKDRPSLPEQQSDLTERVDRLFARWNRRDSPGGAVGVMQNGKILFARGYGMANLEYGIPNTPKTLFHIASVAKQFTAFAVQLLVADGRVSLDDDVRKYLPELPDFGKTITVRHLIYHTSGLRDQPHLMWLGGWRYEDAITEQDFLHVVSRQKELNFPTGQESLYCNTGYTLLAVLVKRISGKSLSEFAQERIFQPLGMKHTLFPQNYGVIIPNRAYSYHPGASGGYEALALSDSTLGATGVVTSIEDMALWDRNFDDGRVGGQTVRSAMLKKGTLDNGTEINRGSGLVIEEYRGLPVIKHSGSIAGYRSRYIRFPDQRFSVVILANTADVNAEDLAWEVANLYLAGKLQPDSPKSAPKAPPVAVRVDTQVLDAYVGDYQFEPGDVVTITRENDQLMAQGTGSGKVALRASSSTTFLLKDDRTQLIFDIPDDTPARSLVLRSGNTERRAKRIAPAPLTDYAGTFYNEELNVLYTVTVHNGTLLLRPPRGVEEMKRTLPDTFSAPFPIDTVRFTRGSGGTCNGFTIDDGRVRNLRFVKVKIEPLER